MDKALLVITKKQVKQHMIHLQADTLPMMVSGASLRLSNTYWRTRNSAAEQVFCMTSDNRSFHQLFYTFIHLHCLLPKCLCMYNIEWGVFPDNMQKSTDL